MEKKGKFKPFTFPNIGVSHSSEVGGEKGGLPTAIRPQMKKKLTAPIRDNIRVAKHQAFHVSWAAQLLNETHTVFITQALWLIFI